MADGPHEMLTLLEEELMRRLCETVGLGLVRRTSRVIAATSGAVAIGDLSVAAGVSSNSSGTAVQGAHRRHAEAAGPHLPFRRHRVRDQSRHTDRLGRPRG